MRYILLMFLLLLLLLLGVVVATKEAAPAKQSPLKEMGSLEEQISAVAGQLKGVDDRIPENVRDGLNKVIDALIDPKQFEVARKETMENFHRSIEAKEKQLKSASSTISRFRELADQANELAEIMQGLYSNLDKIIKSEQRIYEMMKDPKLAKVMLEAQLRTATGLGDDWCKFNLEHRLDYSAFEMCDPRTYKAQPVKGKTKPAAKSEL